MLNPRRRWHRCEPWRRVVGVCPYSGRETHDKELPKRFDNIDSPRDFNPRFNPEIPELERFADEEDVPKDKEPDIWKIERGPGPGRLWKPTREPPFRREIPREGPSLSSTGPSSRTQKEQRERILESRWNNIPYKRMAEIYIVERLATRLKKRREESKESDYRRGEQDEEERRILPRGYKAKRAAPSPIPKKAVPGGNRDWRYVAGAAAAGLTAAAVYGMSRGGGGGMHFPSRPGQPNLTPSRY